MSPSDECTIPRGPNTPRGRASRPFGANIDRGSEGPRDATPTKACGAGRDPSGFIGTDGRPRDPRPGRAPRRRSSRPRHAPSGGMSQPLCRAAERPAAWPDNIPERRSVPCIARCRPYGTIASARGGVKRRPRQSDFSSRRVVQYGRRHPFRDLPRRAACRHRPGGASGPDQGGARRPSRARRRGGGGIPGRELRRQGRRPRNRSGAPLRHRRRRSSGALTRRQSGRRTRRSGVAAGRTGGHRSLRAARRTGGGPHPGGPRRHRVLDGAHSPDHPRPEHGRPVVDGHHRRLQGGAGGGRDPAAHVPDDDDGGRDRHAGPGLRGRGGGGGAAGDRERPPAGGQGRGLRREAGGQGAGGEPGRLVRGPAARHRRIGGRGRLRQGPGRVLLRPAARDDGPGGGGQQRRHHHRPDPRAGGPGAGDRRHGGGDDPGLGGGGPGRRAGRQRRTVAARRGGHGPRRHRARPDQPGVHGAVPRQPDVRPERVGAAAASRPGRWLDRARSRRRHHGGHAGVARPARSSIPGSANSSRRPDIAEVAPWMRFCPC